MAIRPNVTVTHGSSQSLRNNSRTGRAGVQTPVCKENRISRQDTRAVDHGHVLVVLARALNRTPHPRERLATGNAGKRLIVVLVRSPERREHVDGRTWEKLAEAVQVGCRVTADLLARTLAAPVIGPVGNGYCRGRLLSQSLHSHKGLRVKDVAAHCLVHQV